MTSSNNDPIMREMIVTKRILLIRGQKVMINSDLAEIAYSTGKWTAFHGKVGTVPLEKGQRSTR